MIEDRINSKIKIRLAQWGDADIFGEDSGARRKLSDEDALAHFDRIWGETLEPEVRSASQISLEDAQALLDDKLSSYVTSGNQYRQFSLHSVPFIARMNESASSEGSCDQLWDLGTHRDNTRLCVYFDSIEERHRFGKIANSLGWEPKELGLKLMADFLEKFRL